MTILIKIEPEQPNFEQIYNDSAYKNSKLSEIQFKKPFHGTLGKYIFFSDNRDCLIELGKEILLKYNLYHAKVPLKNKGTGGKNYTYVLCIYDSSPKLKQKFWEEYSCRNNINYHYWKSDKNTLKEGD